MYELRLINVFICLHFCPLKNTKEDTKYITSVWQHKDRTKEQFMNKKYHQLILGT